MLGYTHFSVKITEHNLKTWQQNRQADIVTIDNANILYKHTDPHNYVIGLYAFHFLVDSV